MARYYNGNKNKYREWRQKYKDRNTKIIREAKDKPCFDCGVRYPFFVMDFDHVRGKKRRELAIMASHGLGVKTMMDEIAKCDVVCANCHRIRTFGGYNV